MKAEQVWGVLEFYDRELANVRPVQFTPEWYDYKQGEPIPPQVLMGHCRWMIRQCLDVFRPEYESAVENTVQLVGDMRSDDVIAARSSFEKAMRWMCYVQCALNVYGIYSCNDLRDHSRTGGGTSPAGDYKTPAEEHGK